jgi:hypothetical protein
MPPALLISLFSFFFIVSFVYIIRRHYLSGLYYFFLFIYTIFTQLGYAIYPEIAIAKGAYYGREIFFDYWLFVSLSFFAIFIVFRLFWRNRHPPADKSDDVKSSYPFVGRKLAFFATIIAFNVAMFYSFLSNYESIGYTGAIFPSKFFSYGFYIYGIIIMVLYAKLKTFSSNAFEKLLCRVLLLMSLAVLAVISIRSGQRSQIIALAIGIASFEFISSPSKFGKRFIRVSPLIIIALLLAIVLTDLRLRFGGYISPLEFIKLFPAVLGESVRAFFLSAISQDYFDPSLLLFTSMYYELIFPAEVIRSNASNTIVFMGYPYLSERVGRFVNPVGVDRSHGYAYYLLTEGYNLAGWFGILYNALVFWGGLALWQKLFLRGDREFNRFMIAIMAMQVLAIVRGQSVYFIRDIYLFLLPAALLFSLATGVKPAFIRHRPKVSHVGLGLRR